MSKEKKLKIVIDCDGDLYRDRAGILKPQYCRSNSHAALALEIACSDSCSKFDGPFFDLQENLVTIDICGTEIFCKLDEFEDRREQG